MPERQPSAPSDGDLTAKQLRQGIRRLRSLLREITQAYLVRREAEIAALVAWIDDFKPDEKGDKDEPRQRRLLQEISTILGSLKVKPEKGRLKDIKRLHDLVDELHQLRRRQGE
jgi:hypothetical protein